MSLSSLCVCSQDTEPSFPTPMLLGVQGTFPCMVQTAALAFFQDSYWLPNGWLEQLLPSVWLSLHYSCFLTEIFGSTSHSRQWALLRVEVGSASCFVPRCLTTAKCTLAYNGAYKEALMVEWMNEWLNEIFPCFAVPRVWICSGIQLPMWILLRSILGLKSVSFQSYYVYNVSWWKLIEIPPLRPPLIYILYIYYRIYIIFIKWLIGKLRWVKSS